MKLYKEKIVISVGGSLVVPNGQIDTEFLACLNQFIRHQLAINLNLQFFLIIGGGMTARHYRDAGFKVVGHELTSDDLDWLGIQATRLNAHLVRTIFQDIAYPTIIENYDIICKPTEQVVIAAGWKPGWSTDYCATLIGEDYGVHKIINLSNIPQVYDKDPNKFKDAKPKSIMRWKEFRGMVGNTWNPGLNSPFDPIAARKAEELKMTVAVLSGKNFNNIESYISGKKFIGTIIN
jgi:uridylate kinase